MNMLHISENSMVALQEVKNENVRLLTQDKYTQYAKMISQWDNTRFKTMEFSLM